MLLRIGKCSQTLGLWTENCDPGMVYSFHLPTGSPDHLGLQKIGCHIQSVPFFITEILNLSQCCPCCFSEPAEWGI